MTILGAKERQFPYLPLLPLLHQTRYALETSWRRAVRCLLDGRVLKTSLATLSQHAEASESRKQEKREF